MTRSLWRWAFAFLRAIPLLVVLGLFAFAGTIAAQHAYTHHLGPEVILGGVSMVLMAIAGWTFPHPRAFTMMVIGTVLMSFSLVLVLEAGLLWEPVVGFGEVLTAFLVPALLRIMWWPLRKLTYKERKALFRRLFELPYDERMRIMMSGRYDRVLPRM